MLRGFWKWQKREYLFVFYELIDLPYEIFILCKSRKRLH